jgi:hypothetical protein
MLDDLDNDAENYQMNTNFGARLRFEKRFQMSLRR